MRLTGRTDYARQVTVSAETAGVVTQIGMEETRPVSRGAVLAQLETGERQARLEEARANLDRMRLQFQATDKLAQKGFQSELRRAEAVANLRAAEAALRAAELELRNIVIRAPLAGHVERQFVEAGDYVQKGAPIAAIVQIDPLHIRAEVSEQAVGGVALGEKARVTLLSGQVLEAAVRRVAPVATPSTRTFAIVLEAENPDAMIPAGVTADVYLQQGESRAHLFSPALLTLNTAGQVGVKVITEDDRVRFLPVRLLETGQEGSWVTGIPDTVKVISVGQEYVTEGQQVTPVLDKEPQ